MRHVHETTRQRLRKHHRDGRGLHHRRDLERSTEQDRWDFRQQIVRATELAPPDGISMVDLLRHYRDVFRGDFVPDAQRHFGSGAHGVTRPTGTRRTHADW